MLRLAISTLGIASLFVISLWPLHYFGELSLARNSVRPIAEFLIVSFLFYGWFYSLIFDCLWNGKFKKEETITDSIGFIHRNSGRFWLLLLVSIGVVAYLRISPFHWPEPYISILLWLGALVGSKKYDHPQLA